MLFKIQFSGSKKRRKKQITDTMKINNAISLRCIVVENLRINKTKTHPVNK